MNKDFREKITEIQSVLDVPKGQWNIFGKYYYRSCEDIVTAIKPELKKHGLVLILSDKLECIGERYYIHATATLTDGENDFSVSAYAREAENKKGMDESQITGSASSYARKYALNGLLAIDDTKDADSTNKYGQDEEKKEPEIEAILKAFKGKKTQHELEKLVGKETTEWGEQEKNYLRDLFVELKKEDSK